ncbi:sulfite exporter TauE/SafE family protein [Culicoidibacter larvae]|uniref:Probable membrane transporter protein n=1 Tax=Culicoidibacter larvae TaxID=2579976 RepID=A0A5R8QBA1_9FIRM|nr:sulfite exporter TauE/SafE family protein [Culicoidibacter larvae]TLG73805.1 sulfite exporter TauE/SafE family protein [Culicoidibacter larvae]
MLIKIIYFLVIIFANTVGSISGMGGGVLIKPIFDAIGAHTLATITFYSSVAVFTMAIVSTIRQLRNGVRVYFASAAALSAGSVLGGLLGNIIFEKLLFFFPDESSVLLIQIILTIIMLVFVLLFTKENMRSFRLKHWFWYVLVGLFLGGIATLLGIGGGPINVTLLMLCFGMSIKPATVYSIITIFFSQLSKLVTVGFTTGYMVFDLSILWAIIPAAIIGGLLGAKISNILPSNKVMFVYRAVIIVVIVLNIYNLVMIYF